MLDWKTIQYLYINKTHISPELMWAWSGYDVIVIYDVRKRFILVLQLGFYHRLESFIADTTEKIFQI